ncbi:ATP-dependent DNA ligase [Meredithblackwellia eburnea MCA 4105]
MPQHFHRPRPTQDEDNDNTPIGAIPDELPRPKGIENRSSPPFGYLVQLFGGFESATRQKNKKINYKSDLLKHFFLKWRQDCGPDLYPVMRLMLPDRDNRRRTYFLKEQKLGKAYREALDLPPNSSAALKLEKWKTPTAQDPGAGEFSTVAYEVIQSRSSVVTPMGDMTIDDVNKILDDLSKSGNTVGGGTKRSPGAEQARILKICVQRMTALEQKWMIRIILRDLKIGMGERSVFQAFHPDGMELFNTCSDILRVCWKLYDLNYRLPNEDNVVTPGSCFRPMLCQRNQRDLESIVQVMRRGRTKNISNHEGSGVKNEFKFECDEFIIEEKLDGERIQLHKMGKTYQYNSRKSIDYTHHYGKNSSVGSLTPFIDHLFHPDIESVVLDGEMMVWDPSLEKYIPFGTLKTFAMKNHFEPHDPRPCFKVFDVVYIKGNGFEEKLLNKPLWARKQLLHSIFTPKQGVIEIAEIVRASTATHISDFLKRILETRGEGLCVKNPESPYVLGGRVPTWIKVKPEYMDALGENIDGLVIGGFWGTGKRAGRMSSFLIGLRDDTKHEVDGEPYFVSFAKVGSGFNHEVYSKIHAKTDGKWIEFDRRKPPGWFKTVNEWPDVLLAPSNGFVVEIKAAEIVGGNDYGAGMTLRFPRAIRLRDEDKSAANAASFQEVQEMRGAGAGNKRVVGEDLRGKQKKKITAASKKARAVSTQVGKLVKATNIFDGITFYIHQSPSKAALEKAVQEHGGTVIQKIPDRNVTRIIIAEKYEGLKHKKGGKEIDVVKPSWVTDSVSSGRRIPLIKKFFIYALPETEKSEEYNMSEEEALITEIGAEEDEEMGDERSDGDDDVEKVGSSSHLVDPRPSLNRFGPTPLTFRDNEVEDDDDENAGSDDHASRYSEPEPETEDDNDDASKPTPSQHQAPENYSSALQEDEKSEKDRDPVGLTDAPPGMGAGLGEMHVDPDRPFAYFVCYFDTPENAEVNGLRGSQAPSKAQQLHSKQLRQVKEDLVEAGGTTTDDLLNPSLTHIIVHRRMKERVSELITKTASPRNRRVVTDDWVTDTIGTGEGPLDEADYAA